LHDNGLILQTVLYNPRLLWRRWESNDNHWKCGGWSNKRM